MSRASEPSAGHYADWIGRVENRADNVTPASVARMAATLGHDWPAPEAGAPLPPLWHWMYFWPTLAPENLAADGHQARGDFMPPVDLPQRMWAGGRLAFHRPLRVGEAIERRSRIADVAEKTGRSGRLVFVTVEHEVSAAGELAIEERHDIVYRAASEPDAPALAREPVTAPGEPAWSRAIDADAVLLFRYSAVTFNGHRIHYDHPYATGTEGYPDLVVHGPLTATLLLDLIGRKAPGWTIRDFEYRATAPLFANQRFTVNARREGDAIELWATGPDGGLAMRGRATGG